MKLILVVCLLVVGFLSPLAIALNETGAFEGIVRDIEGHAIPGVVVNASSPSLIGGVATAYTDEGGYYRFPALAPGVYKVEAQLAGFQGLSQSDIRLFAGTTLQVNFQLKLVKEGEGIEVTGQPPLIDTSSPAIHAHISSEIVSNLPKLRLIQNLVALTPGVSDDLIAYGADGQKENNFSIDGVSVNDPRLGGRLLIEYDHNWIEEIQVVGIGAPAEYGGFTGIAGNFITRSGGNQFHGLLETFFQNEKLVSTNVPDPAPDIPFKNYEFSGQLGGPILKDRLWFFSGLQYPHNEIHPVGYNGIASSIYKKVITKLTYKHNANNTFQGFANLNRGYNEGEGAAAGVLPEVTEASRNSDATWNSTWISLLSPETNIEARFGGFRTHGFTIEEDPHLAQHIDTATNIASVNSLGLRDRKNSRLQMNAALSHHARDFIRGNHDFRFGVEFERSRHNFNYHVTGDVIYFDYLGAPYERYLYSGYDVVGKNHRSSAYAQDEWGLTDHFSISAGVRWDHNSGITDRGPVFQTDPVAPRLGLVWIWDQDSQTVIKAHYGDYYQSLQARNYIFLSDNGPTGIRQQLNSNGEWETISTFYQSFYTGKNAKLKHPFVRQFNVGIERILPGEVPLGIHYIYRRFGNILEDVGTNDFEPLPFVNPLTGETITVYNRIGSTRDLLFTNPPGLYRRYDGIEFVASKRLGTRLSVSGSFVWSKLSGNYPGDHRFAGPITPFLDDPNSLIHYPGRLFTDRPISWKIVGNYALPFGFNSGWYLRHISGDTWAATANPRLPCCPRLRIFVEEAGSRRNASQTLLDLRFEKEIPVYKGQMRLTVDIFNLFNRAFPLSVEGAVESPNFGKPLRTTEPRTMRLGIRYTF